MQSPRFTARFAPGIATQAILVAALAGCAGGAAQRPAEARPSRPSASAQAPGRIITAAEIQRSGARTAWEALERAHVHVTTSAAGAGRAARLRRRGQRSLLLPSEPIVVLDGVRLDGTSALRDLQAGDVARILVLGGPEATHRYGTGASGGAIVVETRRGGHGAGVLLDRK